MNSSAPPIVLCPVCSSEGSTLHHDLRASLVYACQHCLHEWQLDPGQEPSPNEPLAEDRPDVPSAGRRPLRRP